MAYVTRDDGMSSPCFRRVQEPDSVLCHASVIEEDVGTLTLSRALWQHRA